VHSNYCTAMEKVMSLRSVRPVEPKEITPISVWLITRVVIAMAAILSVAPFIVYYSQYG
jgi:hypothetical protein